MGKQSISTGKYLRALQLLLPVLNPQKSSIFVVIDGESALFQPKDKSNKPHVIQVNGDQYLSEWVALVKKIFEKNNRVWIRSHAYLGDAVVTRLVHVVKTESGEYEFHETLMT